MRRITVRGAMLSVALILAWGSLTTVHATTEHACARHANKSGGPTTCVRHAQGTKVFDDSELPTWPACPTCPPPAGEYCICPWDSVACFIASKVDGAKQPLWKNVFTKHSAEMLFQHGLFYRG